MENFRKKIVRVQVYYATYLLCLMERERDKGRKKEKNKSEKISFLCQDELYEIGGEYFHLSSKKTFPSTSYLFWNCNY